MGEKSRYIPFQISFYILNKINLSKHLHSTIIENSHFLRRPQNHLGKTLIVEDYIDNEKRRVQSINLEN